MKNNVYGRNLTAAAALSEAARSAGVNESEITDEEIDKACAELAEAYGVEVENIKKAVPKEAMIDDMSKKKANDLIIDAAVAIPVAKKTEAE